MKIILLSCCLLFLYPSAISQDRGEPFSFIKTHFERIELPAKITCEALISEKNPSFEFIAYLEAFPYYADTTHHLSRAQFEFLFQAVDTLYGHNLWSLQPCCEKTRAAFYNSFRIYPGAFFEIGEQVLGFIIWTVDDEGIQKILYTMNHDAELIAKLPVAFYQRAGSYTEDDGSKGIWWASKVAVIDPDLGIKMDAGRYTDFLIEESGAIVKK